MCTVLKQGICHMEVSGDGEHGLDSIFPHNISSQEATIPCVSVVCYYSIRHKIPHQGRGIKPFEGISFRICNLKSKFSPTCEQTHNSGSCKMFFNCNFFSFCPKIIYDLPQGTNEKLNIYIFGGKSKALRLKWAFETWQGVGLILRRKKPWKGSGKGIRETWIRKPVSATSQRTCGSVGMLSVIWTKYFLWLICIKFSSSLNGKGTRILSHLNSWQRILLSFSGRDISAKYILKINTVDMTVLDSWDL